MGLINILDTQTSNMIAAGEVVDRPASAIKEMCENAVDAGAKNISVEIKNGGMLYISVSDDGCGIMREDLPKTVLRHATSKISDGSDLDGIKTLGFRGEALAAISSVSTLEIISKRRDEQFGSRLSCDETGVELYEAGCPDGTTVIVKDLFYNVPARRKFMKKDSSEAAACLAVCEKLALSHPEISVSFTSDGVRKFKTSGDSKVYSVIYSLYGSEFARSLLPVEHSQEGITVNGYISKPEFPRGSRSMQSFFVNKRYVKSKTAQAAVEEAYKSYIPSGRFPAAILNISINPTLVDVNVHPAKTEVKFASEKAVFSAIYYAVLGAIAPKPQSVDVSSPKTEHNAQIQTSSSFTPPPKQAPVAEAKKMPEEVQKIIFDPSIYDDPNAGNLSPNPTITLKESIPFEQTAMESPEEGPSAPEAPQFKTVGEAYNTYIFAETKDGIIIIDKHAAHERLIYEELKNRNLSPSQELLFPITLNLPQAQCELLLENSPLLESYGFVLEPFGAGFAAVRAVPARLKDINGLSQILESFAQDIASSTTLAFAERADKALYTMACKAAVKAGDSTHELDAEYLIRRVLETGVKYCPHGRPFIKEIDRKTLDKFFDR